MTDPRTVRALLETGLSDAPAIGAPGRASLTYEGRIDGTLTWPPRGTMGFGYDPVFYLPEYDCTIAELEPADKDSVSHRARALEALLPVLKATFPELGT